MPAAGQVEWLLKGDAPSVYRQMAQLTLDIEPSPGQKFILELVADAPMTLLLSLTSKEGKKPIALLGLETASEDRTRLLVPPRSQWGSLVPEDSDADELYLSKFLTLLNGSLKRHNLWLEAINRGRKR